MSIKVDNIMSQIIIKDGRLISKSSGKIYEIDEFITSVSKRMSLTKKEKNELESYFISYIKPQSDQSKYVENIIEKYDFKFSDGVYIIKENVISIDNIYRLFWKEEKLLPTEVDYIIENVEKISEPMELQNEIFEKIKSKAIKGKSKYLDSLDKIYPNINFRKILYNIIVPKTKPLFHIFYDDGVGGTGKSTLLEVLTKIAGEGFVSNVLLDQFSNRFIFSNMLGKYFNIGDDNGKNDELQNVGTLKSIVTGNRVTIDRKNISPIEVRIFAKQLFATNILPYIDFTDGGIMRRLNIVPMNRVIPAYIKMCELNDDEIGHIIYEVLNSSDLEENNNELAITTSPLYRFHKTSGEKTYNNYKTYCFENGFKQLNIINFEVKSKFIRNFIEKEKFKPLKSKQVSLLEKTDEVNDIF